MTCKQNTS